MTISAAAVLLATLALADDPPASPEPKIPPPQAKVPAPGPLFPVLERGKWGYIDRTGRVVISPRFDAAGRFSDGLAPVALGDRKGWADATGELVLVPEYAPAEAGALHRRFSDGLAVVRDGTKLGYVDRRGRLAIPARFHSAEDFSEGLALTCDAAGCGYVDKTGRGVIGPGFLGGGPFRKGLAAVWVGKGDMGSQRWRLHDRERGWLPGDFEGAGNLADDRLPVKWQGRWGFVDRAGRGVVRPQFAWASDFSEGLAPVAQTVWSCGYLDREGKIVIPTRLRACGPFSSGLARVDLSAANEDAKKQKLAFVDRAGRVVIDGAAAKPPFEEAEDFADGLAAVHASGASGASRLGYVDTTGRYVWPPTE
ncbi:MAG TPA: WG repeat-containing protein [Anaeromyxobacter sp.]|nr:WG repeat-containing protein [Anaeromyxobacter sp.]